MKHASLVIMAGGLGSRYGSLKQVDKLTSTGETILDFSIYDAVSAGFDKVILVIKQETEDMVDELVRGRIDKHIDVDYAYQDMADIPAEIDAGHRKKPWGTGHAVYAARNSISGAFAVINADDLYGREAFEKMHEFLTNAGNTDRQVMVGYRLDNTLSINGSVSRGICEVDEAGKLVGINERLSIYSNDGGIFYREAENVVKLKPDSIASMNFWGFNEKFMGRIEKDCEAFFRHLNAESVDTAEFHLPTSVDHFIKEDEGTVMVLKTDSIWKGITYKDDRSDVASYLELLKEQKLYPEKFWK